MRWRQLTLLLLLALVRPASASPFELSGWLGGRFFASTAKLGYIEAAPFHPYLANSACFGARLSRPLTARLVPEVELALSPTQTNRFGTNVLWLEPRLGLRWDAYQHDALRVFATVGGGLPMTLSTNQTVFATGLMPSGHVGGGMVFTASDAYGLRFDVRLAMVPGLNSPVTVEGEVTVGVVVPLGRPAPVALASKPADDDHDGILNLEDACPERPEDLDGFDDRDGCPDIDNDGDLVLDYADGCPSAKETYNGVADADGCPDAVPPEVDAVIGTIEGVVFEPGGAGVVASPAIATIARVLAAHGDVRVLIIGHADDREVPPGEASDAEAQEQGYVQLALQRAQNVRAYLVGQGISENRIEVISMGRSAPVADNGMPRGRSANRRVELQLFVPPR